MNARGYMEVGIGTHRLNLPMDAVLYFVAPRGARFHTTIHVAGVAMKCPVAITPVDVATIDVRSHDVVVLHYRFNVHSEEMATALRTAAGLEHDAEVEEFAEIDAEICACRDEKRGRSK